MLGAGVRVPASELQLTCDVNSVSQLHACDSGTEGAVWYCMITNYTDWRGNTFRMVLPVIARKFPFKAGAPSGGWGWGFRHVNNPAYPFFSYGLVLQKSFPGGYHITHWFWIGPVGEIFPKVDALNGSTPWNGLIGGEFWNVMVRPKWDYAAKND